jgi:hypothetical protein
MKIRRDCERIHSKYLEKNFLLNACLAIQEPKLGVVFFFFVQLC